MVGHIDGCIWLHFDETMVLTTSSSSSDDNNTECTRGRSNKNCRHKKLALFKESTSGTTTKFPSLEIAFFFITVDISSIIPNIQTYILPMYAQANGFLVLFTIFFVHFSVLLLCLSSVFFSFLVQVEIVRPMPLSVENACDAIDSSTTTHSRFHFQTHEKNHKFDIFLCVVSTYVKGSKRYNKVSS